MARGLDHIGGGGGGGFIVGTGIGIVSPDLLIFL